MMRAVLILSLVASPLAAQTGAAVRPADVLVAPAAAPMLAAPEGPAMIELTAPAAGPALTVLPPARVLPPLGTRPTPRPGVVPAVASPMPSTRPTPRPFREAPEAGLDAGIRATFLAQSGPEDSDPVDSVGPDVVWSVVRIGSGEVPSAVPAVLLPERSGGLRAVLQPAGIAVPFPDLAPVLSRPRPPAPSVQEAVVANSVARLAAASAVLLPHSTGVSAPTFARSPVIGLSTAPRPGRIPASALPPGTLPDGPDALDRATAPPTPEPEPMAAILLKAPPDVLPPAPRPEGPAMPARGVAPPDPEAPLVLPEPDPRALARVIEDAAICWRLAGLSGDARWARVTVEVALDETNMPSATSIRLTGFGGVVSSVAETAYRAAHAALSGCADATPAAAATAAARLNFDHSGVHLR